MAVSERTLDRKLKKPTGDTPKKCIDNVRISYACTLLKNANQSIKDIALASGDSDDTVLRRVFRKTMKTTPHVLSKTVKFTTTLVFERLILNKYPLP